MVRAGFETKPSAVSITARVPLPLPGTVLGPHGEILNGDIVARGAVWANNLDRSSCSTILLGALPIFESDVAQFDTISSLGAHAGPVAVNIERIGISVAWQKQGAG